ncbi:GL13422 [Drosophila persimilis]|uniref:GL13422 n=1 Tax=Drosophila persimilis TaxID=7234 RepID=B4H2Y1_DROPE|nr:GL13422 [Drosophila persimilis]
MSHALRPPPPPRRSPPICSALAVAISVCQLTWFADELVMFQSGARARGRGRQDARAANQATHAQRCMTSSQFPNSPMLQCPSSPWSTCPTSSTHFQSKQPQRKAAEDQNVEDSWECWDDGADGSEGQGDATAAGTAGTESSGAGLVDIALGNSDVSRLNARIAGLEQLNAQLNASLEELDAQHELAMRDVLGRKEQLQLQVGELRQRQADRMVEHEMAIARQQKQLEEHSRAESALAAAKEELQQKLEQQALELKQGVLELAGMQELLEKRGADNGELIDRVRLAEAEREKLLKELDDLKLAKEKKTSESSSNSSSTSTKHSEDEFIVVRQADAISGSGSGSDPDPDPDPTQPPSKEKLRDKLVALETLIAELNLANSQLQDAQLEKELSSSLLGDQLAELETRLRISEGEKEQLQLELQFKLQQLTMQNQELKLNAEAEQETHTHDLEQQMDTLRADNRRLRQELDASIAQAKFRQAIAEEKQEIIDLDDALGGRRGRAGEASVSPAGPD